MSTPLLHGDGAPSPPRTRRAGRALAAFALVLAGTALGAALAGFWFAAAAAPPPAATPKTDKQSTPSPPAWSPAEAGAGAGAAAARQSPHHAPPLSLFSPSCLTPLGGGAIRSSGILPLPRTRSPACWPGIRHYVASGAYDADVAAAVNDAAAYLASIPRPGPGGVVVLDVDETALSNRAEWLRGGGGDDGGGGGGGGGGTLPPLPARLEAAALRGDAPALGPTLRLYTAARAAGFTVAFVTGRPGRAEVRNATAANLEAAGYGRPCSGGGEGGDGGGAASGPPCYAALLMRPEREGAPASAVKPSLRAALLARLPPGARLVASVGDNFSDLGGEPTPAAAFKLPNPVYYVV